MSPSPFDAWQEKQNCRTHWSDTRSLTNFIRDKGAPKGTLAQKIKNLTLENLQTPL